MKITLLSDSGQNLGGGFSFRNNLTKGLKALGHEVVDSIPEAQVAIVSGATMVNRDTVREVKEKGVKLVTRIDNIPRNSRNRNTGTSRLKDYATWADAVVYQSRWAKDYISDFVERDGPIIYNGVDEDVFKPEGAKRGYNGDPIYLYSRFSRDETKNWEVAWYEYQMIQRENPDALLVLIGKFSPDNKEYSFDFFRGERYEEPMIIDNPKEMAQVYRSCDYLMAPYYNDAFSNTYLEFLMTKDENRLYKPDISGGTREMLILWEKKGREFFGLKRMTEDYIKVFEKLL